MYTLKGKKVFLRALEPTDLVYLHNLENDEELWEVSNTITPFSEFLLTEYLENSGRDIYDIKQLRLVICNNQDAAAVGFIDLYDFDPKNDRVGVGVVIYLKEDRKQGFAKEALLLTCNYAFEHLDVHQVFAGITEDNIGSIALFEKAGFERTGAKKDWIKSAGRYKTEYIYQLFQKESLNQTS